MVKEWADEVDDADADGAEDLRKRLGGFATEATQSPEPSTAPANESPAVASLASRIGGLSTDAEPAEPASSSRPRLNPNAPIFGKALAGVKADRSPAPAASATPETPAPAPAAPATEPAKTETAPEEKDKMTHDTEKSVQSIDMDNASGLVSNDFQVQVKLADQQADPNSPLYSVKEFSDLPIHANLLKGIYAANFKHPSKIQEKALPLLLANPPQNLIGQSQSGTGKTAAFTLNMLSRVDPALMTPQAICLAPSRELARQIQEVVDRLGQFTDIKSFLAVPGSWKRGVKIDRQILIGTPGTITDMLSRGTSIFDPKQIRVFVLDEADEMIQLQGLGDQTFRIKKMLPPGVQNVLFSATFPDAVQEFAALFAPEANQIYLKKEDITVDAIKQLYLECDDEQGKFNALAALYDILTIGQSIVFCRRKVTADNIQKGLTELGHTVASLHGDKMTHERDEILDGFREGKTKVLITTNVIARGIDIQQVNMVVNYDIPDLGPEGNYRPDIETYIHRIGRTGRFGRKGVSVTFVHDDRTRQEVFEIMEALGKRMKKIDATSASDLDTLETALKAALKGPN